MSYTFRKAVRENIGLVVGLAGASGSGKTMSALRLAQGMAGGRPFVVLDTENGRAKHYADRFSFDTADIVPPFRPSTYAAAIAAADKAGYAVIVVDSCSHEHAGEGGLLDWHEEELERMAGEDWKKRDACNMAAWVKPKMEHKQFVNTLLRTNAHLILAFRAEQKVEMTRGKDGRMEIVPKKIASGFSDWIPICEKNMLYELTVSFLLTPEKPGVPIPIKLQEQHKPCFPAGKHLDEEAGARLAEWASGSAGGSGANSVTDAKPGAASSGPPADCLNDWKAKIEDLQDTIAAQRCWDEIVKDGTLKTKERAVLYALYQEKVKGLK